MVIYDKFTAPKMQHLFNDIYGLSSKDGVWRVHGGGFEGTTLAFVHDRKLSEYTHAMDRVFGEHAASVLSIRNYGAIEVTTKH